jgi:hypothetical protein
VVQESNQIEAQKKMANNLFKASNNIEENCQGQDGSDNWKIKRMIY